MLRTVKFGLSGALVAGVIGGTVAWTDVHATAVHLVIDGRSRTVETRAATVGALLADAGYRVGPHDLVAPAASSKVSDGETVVYRHGRLLRLDIDGQQRDIWTTAPTVAAALADLGYGQRDFVSVSRSRRLPLTPTDVSLRTPKAVSVVHDGKTTRVETTVANVGQLLSEMNVTLGRYDELSSPTNAPLYDGERLTVQRVVHATQRTYRTLRFPTTTRPDEHLPQGTTKVVRKGRSGRERTAWAVVYIDGKLVSRRKIGSSVTRRPVTQLERRGTMLGPDATPAQAQALARSLLGDYGFSSDQMGCLIQLWNSESSWRVTARNPNGGAYGIPQALPADKLASAGPDWRISAETQIRWGLQYIKSSYGTPCEAWATWQAHGGWY